MFPTALQHVGLLQGPPGESWVPSKPTYWLEKAPIVCGVFGFEWPLPGSWVACSPAQGPRCHLHLAPTLSRLGVSGPSPSVALWVPGPCHSPVPLLLAIGVPPVSSLLLSFWTGVSSSGLYRFPFLYLEHHCVGGNEKKFFFLIIPRFELRVHTNFRGFQDMH